MILIPMYYVLVSITWRKRTCYTRLYTRIKFCHQNLQKGGVCTFVHKDIYLSKINPYPTAFPYVNGMVLHFYQQQESSTTKTVHKVINKGLKAYV